MAPNNSGPNAVHHFLQLQQPEPGMPNKPKQSPGQPYFVIGAGHLISHVYRIPNNRTNLAYQFNLFRISEFSEATHTLRPEDLRDVVKACQVLAFSIADDGWLSEELRNELVNLAGELEAVTQQWGNEHED